MTRRAALAAAILVIVLTSAAGPAVAQPRCTQETLNVRGVPVTIGYCVTGPPLASAPDEIALPVQATYASPGGSFGRVLELHFVSGEGVSRILQSLPLRELGLTGTLHLTLAYAGGLVRIEGAMLTPGAITIK